MSRHVIIYGYGMTTGIRIYCSYNSPKLSFHPLFRPGSKVTLLLSRNGLRGIINYSENDYNSIICKMIVKMVDSTIQGKQHDIMVTRTLNLKDYFIYHFCQRFKRSLLDSHVIMVFLLYYELIAPHLMSSRGRHRQIYIFEKHKTKM